MLQYLISALVFISPVAWAASGFSYSTYLRQGFTPSAVATDPAGNVYVAGSALSGAQPSQTAALVVKLDSAGARYVYTRVLGGSATDTAQAIAVDSSGNAYVAGTTSSPDFPVTPGVQTGTLPAANDTRAFLIKLDPQGEIEFAGVLGNVTTSGAAVAIAPDGGILVSGTSGAGLASSGGAYSVPDTKYRPFLMKLDPTGSVLFTATGIGGDALALDAAGNIYMAGSTGFTDYPTTPGAYQPVLNPVFVCFFPCQISFPGSNQYLSKVDPAGRTLLYSTGVAGPSQTLNQGLAVDAAGNAYLTGVAYGEYNWTVQPRSTALVEPFLTKIDAAGAHALYSIPIGGAGVALGPQGDPYVGGAYNDISFGGMPNLPLAPPPPGVAVLPGQCQVNNITTFSEAYVSHVDAATGNVLDTVLVDGSDVGTAGIAVAGGGVWLTGPTSQPDTPITPGAPVATGLKAGSQAGAYLGMANFKVSPTAGPQVACVLDGANESRAGVVSPGQLLTLFGGGLGPPQGVSAANHSTLSLGGVFVKFNGTPAPLLYVSTSQINVAVPSGLAFSDSQGFQNFAAMEVSVNGAAAPAREFPVVPANPSLFADLSGTISSCTIGGNTDSGAFIAFALNADGSVNSCQHRAAPGSVISLFINGLGIDFAFGEVQDWTPELIPVAVTIGQWSAEVVNVSAQNPNVWQLDIRIPEAAASNPGLYLLPVTVDMNFTSGVTPVGPLSVQPFSPYYTAPGTPFPLSIWMQR